ncbi:MAG TPA: AI-2E family transporter [Egibacteraceae bacterium]|nr:AI-2E family transporter [Egibacteraceae bacterium]
MAIGRVRPPVPAGDDAPSGAPDLGLPEPPADVADPSPAATARPALSDRPLVRAGVIAWSVTGLLVLAAAVGILLSRLTVVIVPMIVALFPAAVLVPPTSALKRRGWPPALAALVVMTGALGLLAALFSFLAPAFAAELGGLADKVEQGYGQVRLWLRASPLGIEALPMDEALDRVRQQAGEQGNGIGGRILEAGTAVVHGVTGIALALFTLFFYLKDGSRIARWLRDLFPRRVRADLQGIGDRVWFTIGAYIRGLLVIGLVDAVLIGTGLALLGIPLALPLAVLVFFGALFPIVGAFLAGTIAVLVALAANGLGAAIAVLVLIVVVQQLEGHILTPVMLGRATEMHPLAVIAVLTSGALLMGVAGAFLSVPVAASLARALAYVRNRPRAAVTPAQPV